jgi:hypothetical protein
MIAAVIARSRFATTEVTPCTVAASLDRFGPTTGVGQAHGDVERLAEVRLRAVSYRKCFGSIRPAKDKNLPVPSGSGEARFCLILFNSGRLLSEFEQ